MIFGTSRKLVTTEKIFNQIVNEDYKYKHTFTTKTQKLILMPMELASHVQYCAKIVQKRQLWTKLHMSIILDTGLHKILPGRIYNYLHIL